MPKNPKQIEKCKAWRRRKAIQRKVSGLDIVRDETGTLGWFRGGQFAPISNQEWAEQEYRRRGFRRMPRR